MNNRIDLFTTIHKGLRWWMGDISARLGAAEYEDIDRVSLLLAEVLECLDVLDEHSNHEDTFIAPIVDARAGYRSAPWHAEHEALEHAAQSLRRQAQELQAQDEHSRRVAMGLELYRAFARFTSDVYLHLDEEETLVMPLLWSVATEDELAGILAAFRAEYADYSARLYARLAPALSPAERTLLGV